ncbi:MAG TPA: 7-carboxy-7-deazaguanine synthase QueE [Ktedonobacterales bacterium]|jgi:7-carboxy-7-deazaguanine synthase|nr:7-carboxy-7-deazaguanine synthase QueE [Ktedonobacterales bacterium]
MATTPATSSRERIAEARGARHGAARTFPVLEVFGPVLQGEGRMIGAQTHFVRFGYCDYRCAWCDTLYAVEPEQVQREAEWLNVDAIVGRLDALGAHTIWVTLSGGNPAIHDLGPLVERLHASGRKVAIETQGSVYRPWLATCDVVTVSPKPPSSGMVTDYARLARFIALPQSNLKVVIFDDADFTYARDIHQRYPDRPLYLQPGNAVGRDDTAALLAKLDWLAHRAMADAAMADAIVLPQLHTLMYGNRRGV